MDSTRNQPLVLGLWGVRYQVKDVQRSIAFYTQTLGFDLGFQALPAFGQVSIGALKLVLSGPGASGSRQMPDGRQQEPGGWNRVMLQVKDLPARTCPASTLADIRGPCAREDLRLTEAVPTSGRRSARSRDETATV